MLIKCAISNDFVTVLEARGKSTLYDIKCYCKMTSILALGGVTSFLRLKDVTYSCKINVCDTGQLLTGFLQCNGGKLEEAEDFKCVFVVYCVLESK